MRGQTGFSIPELMVTVLIVAILLGVGVPSYRYINNSYRMSAEINSLAGDLMYARAEAIREGQPVAICVSVDHLTCSGATTWQSGWIVFPDPGNNGANDVPGTILHVQQAFTGAQPDAFTLANPISSIIFNREGFAQGDLGAAFAANQFTLKDATANSSWTRCLTITAQGMIQSVNHVSAPATCN